MTAHSPEQTHDLVAAALNARDADALAELYEEDAVLIAPPEGERVTGREAIRAAVGPILSLEPHARFEVVGKLESGGLAMTHGRWAISGTGPDGPVEMSGRGVMVTRRQSDGSWRILLDDPMRPEGTAS